MRERETCVEGHTLKLFGQWKDDRSNHEIDKEVCYILGIDFSWWSNDIFIWLFSYIWNERDNTPTGAAKRIEYIIEHGKPPSNFNDILYKGEKYPWE